MASSTESLGHHDTQRSRQLEFSKAMSDFTSMFPSVEYEVIEMVLRANNGLVDATVDQLLAMQDETNETENKHVDPDLNVRLPGYNDASPLPTNEPPPAYTPRLDEDDTNFWYDSTFLKQQTGSFSSSTSSQNTPVSSKMKNWNPPLVGTLPNDFLRISLNDTISLRTPPFTNSSSREEVEPSRLRNHENFSREFIPWPSRTSTQTPNAVIQDGNHASSVVARPSTVNGFDAIPDSESTPSRTPKCSGHKSKSKRFGQMSRKFKRKKTKSPKNNYQPISSANLIDEDSGEERDVQR